MLRLCLLYFPTEAPIFACIRHMKLQMQESCHSETQEILQKFEKLKNFIQSKTLNMGVAS
jgi:hypothetical protein